MGTVHNRPGAGCVLPEMLTAVFQDDALERKSKTGRDQGVSLGVGDALAAGRQLALNSLYGLEAMGHGCLGERGVGCDQLRGGETQNAMHEKFVLRGHHQYRGGGISLGAASAAAAAANRGQDTRVGIQTL